MPKYSVDGSSASKDGNACELCGTESSSVSKANVAGAKILVCGECSPHDDSQTAQDDTGESGHDDRNVTAEATDASASLWDGDTSRWENEGTGYIDDPLPYLIDGYGDVVREAREERGVSVDELAERLQIPAMDLLSVERGQAAQSGVSGSVISDIETALEISVVDET